MFYKDCKKEVVLNTPSLLANKPFSLQKNNNVREPSREKDYFRTLFHVL